MLNLFAYDSFFPVFGRNIPLVIVRLQVIKSSEHAKTYLQLSTPTYTTELSPQTRYQSCEISLIDLGACGRIYKLS